MIATLLPLAQQFLGGLSSGLGGATPGQQDALSTLLSGLFAKLGLGGQGGSGSGSQAPAGAPAAAGSLDSQILQAIQALASGHRITMDMTLRVEPRA
jgi:hypothetical protein